MRIDDLPHFTISQIEVVSEQVRLAGRFTTVVGVRNGRSWLLMPDHFIIGDLVHLDTQSKTAIFISPDTVAAQIPQATSLPWLDGYWQAYLVQRIADPDWTWTRIKFAPDDAIQFTQGEVRGWTKIGSTLPPGSKRVGVLPKGWDHEHCEICNGKIGISGDSFGYVDSEDCWLCEQCYEKYASRHDVSFTRVA